jgi:NADPH:quinone reductase-like Zn-dependent oxidoreductase
MNSSTVERNSAVSVEAETGVTRKPKNTRQVKNNTMKAIVNTQYGSPDVLEFNEVGKPTPKENEVLVKIHAASVNAGDWHLLRGTPFPVKLVFGIRKPKVQILGTDIAGRVEAVGQNVTQFKPGDAVFADLSGFGFGAFAEYKCVPEDGLVSKPVGMTFEQAAAVPSAALTALQGIRDKGKIQPGQKVLIHGAAGGVGSFAVQIAKSFGADVTGVCSTQKMEMVRSIGADHVIDYTQEDCTDIGQRYDLIFDAAAFRSIFDFKRALKPKGIYVFAGGSGNGLLQVMLLGPFISLFSGKKMTSMLVRPNQKDLAFIGELMESGKVIPFIDKRFPLSEVANAIRYIEDRRVQGKVVITYLANKES